MTHIIFVVSRDHLELLPELTRENPSDMVEIIVDRRRRERRQTPYPTQFADRRHSDRRLHSNSHELELLGVAVYVCH